MTTQTTDRPPSTRRSPRGSGRPSGASCGSSRNAPRRRPGSTRPGTRPSPRPNRRTRRPRRRATRVPTRRWRGPGTSGSRPSRGSPSSSTPRRRRRCASTDPPAPRRRRSSTRPSVSPRRACATPPGSPRRPTRAAPSSPGRSSSGSAGSCAPSSASSTRSRGTRAGSRDRGSRCPRPAPTKPDIDAAHEAAKRSVHAALSGGDGGEPGAERHPPEPPLDALAERRESARKHLDRLRGPTLHGFVRAGGPVFLIVLPAIGAGVWHLLSTGMGEPAISAASSRAWAWRSFC
jgi:hypothetical protein